MLRYITYSLITGHYLTNTSAWKKKLCWFFRREFLGSLYWTLIKKMYEQPCTQISSICWLVLTSCLVPFADTRWSSFGIFWSNPCTVPYPPHWCPDLVVRSAVSTSRLSLEDIYDKGQYQSPAQSPLFRNSRCLP